MTDTTTPGAGPNSSEIHRKRLLWAGFMAILAAGVGFAIRGGIFDNWVTEGDGLRQAAAARCSVYDITGANADRQSLQFQSITAEFLQKCP